MQLQPPPDRDMNLNPAPIAITTLASLMTLSSIAWAVDAPLLLDLDIYPAQFFCWILQLALPLAFLSLPAQRGTPRETVPWYDWFAAVACFSSVGYLTWQYQQVVDLILLRPTDVVVFGFITLTLSLEGLRRATGKTLPIIALVFIAYALLGDVFPGRMAAQATDWQKLTAYLALDVNGVLGLPLAVASTIVIAFLLFGQLLNISGGSHFFTDIAMLTMGRFRGGPAKIAVAGSALFGSISGSAVANVVATGVITIPMIKRAGYPAHRAAAIEAAASTGGQLMPPVMGASAFLMAEFLQIPYADVVLAALVPGLLYYIALFVQADLEAAKLNAKPMNKADMPAKRKVLKGLYFLLPFAVLIIALFNFNQTPQMSALLAAVVVIALSSTIGYDGHRLKILDIFNAIRGAGMATLDIVMVCVAAGIVIGVLGISGLGFNLTFTLVQIGQGSLAMLLFLAAGVCIVLGMGLPTVGVYVLLATLVAPALVEVGIQPIAAHLYVMYFGMMSMITPPVAIAAYAGATIAKADPIKTCFSAIRFGWPAYVVPFLFVLSPLLLFNGPKLEVAWAVATAIGGVWLVTVSVIGYFSRNLDIITRLLFAVAGFALLIPADVIPAGMWVNIGGLIAGVLLMLREIASRRRREARKV